MKKNPFPLQLNLLSKAGSPLNADQILENVALNNADMLEQYYGNPQHSKMQALATTIQSIVRRQDISSENKLRSVSSLLRAVPISTERIRDNQIRAFRIGGEKLYSEGRPSEADYGPMQPLDYIWAAFEDGNGSASEFHPLYRQSSGRSDAPARTLYHGGNRWDAFEGNRSVTGPSPDSSLASLANFYGPTFDASNAASYAAKFAMNPENRQPGSRYVHAISHPDDFNFFDGSHTTEIDPEDFARRVMQSGALHYTGLSDEDIRSQLLRPSKREISWNGNLLDDDDPAQVALRLKPHTGYGMYQRLLQIATNHEKNTTGYLPNAYGSSGVVRQTDYSPEQGAKVAVNGILGAIGYDGISHPVSEEQRIVQTNPLAKDEEFPSEGGDSTNFHIFPPSMPRVTSGTLDNRINARAGDVTPRWGPKLEASRAHTPQQEDMLVSLPYAARNDPAYGRLTLVDPPPPARDMPQIADNDTKEEPVGGRTPIMNSPQPGFTPRPPPLKPDGFDPVKLAQKPGGFTPRPPSLKLPGFDPVKPPEKPEGFTPRPPSLKLDGFDPTAKTPTGQTVLPGPAMSTLKRSWFNVSIRRFE